MSPRLNDPQVGITHIDHDHARIGRYLAKLEQTLLLGQARQAALIAPTLAEFTAAHFATEQALMSEWAYPMRRQHENEHQRLLAALGELVARVAGDARSESPCLDTALVKLGRIADQLNDHIALWDTPMTSFLGGRKPF
jgi:hemerythrin-like metal-binding protein